MKHQAGLVVEAWLNNLHTVFRVMRSCMHVLYIHIAQINFGARDGGYYV